MTPISIKVSDITYVDFKNKRILDQKVYVFDKMELLHEGLIDFNRLVRRGKVKLVYCWGHDSAWKNMEKLREQFRKEVSSGIV